MRLLAKINLLFIDHGAWKKFTCWVEPCGHFKDSTKFSKHKVPLLTETLLSTLVDVFGKELVEVGQAANTVEPCQYCRKIDKTFNRYSDHRQ